MPVNKLEELLKKKKALEEEIAKEPITIVISEKQFKDVVCSIVADFMCNEVEENGIQTALEKGAYATCICCDIWQEIKEKYGKQPSSKK